MVWLNLLISTRGQNILDLILVRDPLLIYNITLQPPLATSDHNCIRFNFQLGDLKNPSSNLDHNVSTGATEKIFDFNNADWVSFHDYLSTVDWLYTFRNCTNIEDYLSCLCCVLTEGMNRFIPYKYINSASPAKQ